MEVDDDDDDVGDGEMDELDVGLWSMLIEDFHSDRRLSSLKYW